LKVRLFLNEYDGINLEDSLVSYTKKWNCLGNILPKNISGNGELFRFSEIRI